MNNNKSAIQNLAAPALALLGLLVALAPAASAKHSSTTPAETPATVIAHVAIPGTPASGLLLQQVGEKQYLYVEQASQDGFAIVNVTNPSQPDVIKRAEPAKKAYGGELRLVSGGLALAEAVEADSAAADPPPSTSTVRILDLSDPANPRVILNFSGVTSTLADEPRSLIYITNSEGLWILQNNQALAEAAERHPCTTADAIDDVASCQ